MQLRLIKPLEFYTQHIYNIKQNIVTPPIKNKQESIVREANEVKLKYNAFTK